MMASTISSPAPSANPKATLLLLPEELRTDIWQRAIPTGEVKMCRSSCDTRVLWTPDPKYTHAISLPLAANQQMYHETSAIATRGAGQTFVFHSHHCLIKWMSSAAKGQRKLVKKVKLAKMTVLTDISGKKPTTDVRWYQYHPTDGPVLEGQLEEVQEAAIQALEDRLEDAFWAEKSLFVTVESKKWELVQGDWILDLVVRLDDHDLKETREFKDGVVGADELMDKLVIGTASNAQEHATTTFPTPAMSNSNMRSR